MELIGRAPLFLFAVMANGQSFSLLGDSLNYGMLIPDKIGVQLKPDSVRSC
jgi:hypothetical protein